MVDNRRGDNAAIPPFADFKKRNNDTEEEKKTKRACFILKWSKSEDISFKKGIVPWQVHFLEAWNRHSSFFYYAFAASLVTLLSLARISRG